MHGVFNWYIVFIFYVQQYINSLPIIQEAVVCIYSNNFLSTFENICQTLYLLLIRVSNTLSSVL
jgi:hypothetical protein